MKAELKIEGVYIKIFVDDLLYLIFSKKDYSGIQSHINSEFIVKVQHYDHLGFPDRIDEKIITRYFIEIYLRGQESILCEWEKREDWEQILNILNEIPCEESEKVKNVIKEYADKAADGEIKWASTTCESTQDYINENKPVYSEKQYSQLEKTFRELLSRNVYDRSNLYSIWLTKAGLKPIN